MSLPAAKPLLYIDLFAGAGGLSEGFERAGFTPVAHVEIDADACNTLRTRQAWYHLRREGQQQTYYNYLQQRISRAELYADLPSHVCDSVINLPIGAEHRKEIFTRIDAQLARFPENEGKVDVIIGGPPCQAFSIAGRARVGREAMERDPRSRLFHDYADFLDRYKPRMFVFENVLGLLSFRKSQQLSLLRAAFLDAGYEMDVREWNARQFGVLQSRDRLVIIGWRTDQPRLGYPEFNLLSEQQQQRYTVGELLSTLPPLTSDYKHDRNARLPVYPYPHRLVRGAETDYVINRELRDQCPVLTWHVARPAIERDRRIYQDHIADWNAHLGSRPRLKYADLAVDLKTHKNEKDFSDRFKVVAANLPYSQTVVAHIQKDGHYYIHPDLDQARSLSVREAARLQSFPDNFFFEGSRTAAFRQIGNAVPPLMAAEIARSVGEVLRGAGEVLPADSPLGKQRTGRVERLVEALPLFRQPALAA